MSYTNIAKKTMEKEAEGIVDAASQLTNSFNDVIELLKNCKGKITTMGMGKSGHIARKIAATLASTGSSAFYIHPSEAKHGDLGMISAEDICIAISHSGETREVLEIIPIMKKINKTPIISITKNEKNSLAKLADFKIRTNVNEEACPFNLAPTTSTTVTLAIGDAIAVALMKAKNFSKSEFSIRHPGGSLGKKLLYDVEDVMIDEIPIVHEKTKLIDILMEMSNKKLGMTAVVDNKKRLQGVITDGDIRRAIQKFEKTNIVAEDIMSKKPKFISKKEKLGEALEKMEMEKITSLVVSEDGEHIEGILHIHHVF